MATLRRFDTDQKKTPEFYSGSGVQFPGSAALLRGFNKNLHTDRDLVKYRTQHDEQERARAGRDGIG